MKLKKVLFYMSLFSLIWIFNVTSGQVSEKSNSNANERNSQSKVSYLWNDMDDDGLLDILVCGNGRCQLFALRFQMELAK